MDATDERRRRARAGHHHAYKPGVSAAAPVFPQITPIPADAHVQAESPVALDGIFLYAA
jgi:hypothetical protein